MRAVRKVSVHFEYLENRWRGLDITRHSLRGDFCASVNSHSPVGLVSRLSDAADLCTVTVAFTMTERDELQHDHAPAQSTVLVQAFLAVTAPRSVSPLQTISVPATCGFPKIKIVFEREIFECDGHKVHKLSHCRLISPTGVTVHGRQ